MLTALKCVTVAAVAVGACYASWVAAPLPHKAAHPLPSQSPSVLPTEPFQVGDEVMLASGEPGVVRAVTGYGIGVHLVEVSGVGRVISFTDMTLRTK